MNEYTVNIPIEEYDRLRKIELIYNSKNKSFFSKIEKYVNMNIDIKDNFEFCEKVKLQNEIKEIFNNGYYAL